MMNGANELLNAGFVQIVSIADWQQQGKYTLYYFETESTFAMLKHVTFTFDHYCCIVKSWIDHSP